MGTLSSIGLQVGVRVRVRVGVLSRTSSVMPRETHKHTARGSAHASEPKSRRKVHVENVHEVELPKDPMIVVGCGELVARELAAREHHTQRLR